MINVVGAVIVRNHTVLSAQRGPSMSLAGMWEFPGGKIEHGETPEEAVRREMREELLCKIDVGERVETTCHTYDFGTVALTTFYATLVDGEPTRTEHSAIRWIPIAELDSLIWAPADIPAVMRVMSDFSDA